MAVDRAAPRPIAPDEPARRVVDQHVAVVEQHEREQRPERQRSPRAQQVPRQRSEHQPGGVVEEHLRVEREACSDTDERARRPSGPARRRSLRRAACTPAAPAASTTVRRSPQRRRDATPMPATTVIGGLIASSVRLSPSTNGAHATTRDAEPRQHGDPPRRPRNANASGSTSTPQGFAAMATPMQTPRSTGRFGRDRPERADPRGEHEHVVEVRVDHCERRPRLHDHEPAEQHGELQEPLVQRRLDHTGSSLEHVDRAPARRRSSNTAPATRPSSEPMKRSGAASKQAQRPDLDRRIVRVEVEPARERRVAMVLPEEQLATFDEVRASPCPSR